MTIRELLEKIENLKRAGLLRDESTVKAWFDKGREYLNVEVVRDAIRTTPDTLTLVH